DPPATVADPSVVLPSRKVTLPVGATLPAAGLTVAVSTVLAVTAKAAGLAASVVVVETGMFKTKSLDDPRKLPSAKYSAMMSLAPADSAIPFTAKFAVAELPAAGVSATVARVLPASVNATLPLGAFVPVAA